MGTIDLGVVILSLRKVVVKEMKKTLGEDRITRIGRHVEGLLLQKCYKIKKRKEKEKEKG